MRIVAVASICLATFLFGGCSNPWARAPDSALTRWAERRMATPTPRLWGNYCGFGTRSGDLSLPPVDPLDRACLAHDVCYIEGRHRCACDDALVDAARVIARDSPDGSVQRRRARIVVSMFSTDFCRAFPHGLLPPRDPALLRTQPG